MTTAGPGGHTGAPAPIPATVRAALDALADHHGRCDWCANPAGDRARLRGCAVAHHLAVELTTRYRRAFPAVPGSRSGGDVPPF